MELKKGSNPADYTWSKLLIVPYGIETGRKMSFAVADALLIVPYGI